MRNFSGATLASKILGFLRDAMVVAVFGGGRVTDAYYAVFRISNIFRRAVAEGGANLIIVPALESEKDKNSFLNAFLTVVTVASLLLSVSGIVFRKEIIKLAAYGFTSDGGQFLLASSIAVLFFSQFVFIAASSVFQAALNSRRKYFIPALSPSVFSMAIIIYLSALKAGFLSGWSPESKAVILSSVALLASAAQFLFLLFLFVKAGFSPNFTNPLKKSGAVRSAALLLPALIISSQEQILMLIGGAFASFMEPGSLTALYNSLRMAGFPTALFAIAASQVSLKEFSEKNFSDSGGLEDVFRYSLKIILFILLPSVFGLMSLSGPVTDILFRHGRFSEEQSILTARTLFFLSPAIMAFGVNKVAGSFYFAKKKISFMMKACFFGFGLNLLFCLLFFKKGAPGIAVAASASSTAVAMLVIRDIGRMTGIKMGKSDFVQFLKLAALSAAVFPLARISHSLFLPLGKTAALFLSIAVSAGFYLGGAEAWKARPAAHGEKK